MDLVVVLAVVLVLSVFTARRRLQWAVKRRVGAGDVPSRPIDVASEDAARTAFLAAPCTCKRSYTTDSLRSTTVRFADEERFVIRAECASCIESRTRYYRLSVPTQHDHATLA